MAKTPEILNLHVFVAGGVKVCWETPDGFRWHVGIVSTHDQTLAPPVPVTPYAVSFRARDPKVLRKNPPETPRYGHKGSWLDPFTKANAPMVQHALQEAERLGLYQVAVAKAAADEQARVDAIRDEQAADMLAAAERLLAEGLPGAADFLASVQQLTPDQQARMLQLIKWGGR